MSLNLEVYAHVCVGLGVYMCARRVCVVTRCVHM